MPLRITSKLTLVQSQAVIAGPHIFVSGQLPADAQGNLVEGSIADKTKACCENLKNILGDAGSSITRVVKVGRIDLHSHLRLSRRPAVAVLYWNHEAACMEACQLTLRQATVFLTSMDNFAEMNKVYEQYFTHKPSRSCVAVKELPKGVPGEADLTHNVCAGTDDMS